MARINNKAFDLILSEFLMQKKKSINETPSVDSEKLKKVRIDISKKKHILYNFVIEKMLFSSTFEINIIDENKSLDGKFLKGHDELHKLTQKKWNNNVKEIDFNSLYKLNIWTSLTTIKIGNFKLYSSIFNSNSYEISLINEKKDGYGLWVDSVVDHKKIISSLDLYSFSKHKQKDFSENKLNEDLVKHLSKSFSLVTKSKGAAKGLLDIIIGDNFEYVIELKLAKQLIKNDKTDRAIGQMERYLEELSKQKKSNNKKYMILIAGSEKEIRIDNIKRIKSKAKKLGVNYYYLSSK